MLLHDFALKEAPGLLAALLRQAGMRWLGQVEMSMGAGLKLACSPALDLVATSADSGLRAALGCECKASWAGLCAGGTMIFNDLRAQSAGAKAGAHGSSSTIGFGFVGVLKKWSNPMSCASFPQRCSPCVSFLLVASADHAWRGARGC